MTENGPGPEFWSAIEPFTGIVSDFHRTERGTASDMTAIVSCESGSFFVKAMRNVPGGRRDQIERERLINPHVLSMSPLLRWHVDEGEWYALGFDLADGRCAEFAPGSPDLPAAVRLLNRVAATPVPDIALNWTETRWDRFTNSDEEIGLLQGSSFLHADVHPNNFIIGAQGNWLVDWAWPTVGAAFIDPSCLVVQLVAAGHSPESAESWAARCEVWEKADPRAVDVFCAATARMWGTQATRFPDAYWLRSMADAAESWATHRHVAV